MTLLAKLEWTHASEPDLRRRVSRMLSICSIYISVPSIKGMAKFFSTYKATNAVWLNFCRKHPIYNPNLLEQYILKGSTVNKGPDYKYTK